MYLKQAFLEEFPDVEFENSGQLVYEVRTEVAHSSVKINILKKYDFNRIYKLSKFMEMVVIGYILIDIGVDEPIVEYYQKWYY